MSHTSTPEDRPDMTDRRTFVAALGAAALGTVPARELLAAPWVRTRAAHDLVIRGGTMFDGTGAAGIEADVAIAGDRIAGIARRIADRGTEEIDARGLAVAPGFIDIHSHGDGNMDEDPRQE